MEANQIRPWLRSSSVPMPRCLHGTLGPTYVIMNERQAKVDEAWTAYKKKTFFRGTEEAHKRETEAYESD